MFNRMIGWVFRLYEIWLLRNWFYTFAYVIVVPTGFWFACIAWEHGPWFAKPLAIFSGLVIGIQAAVTLVRIWKVPPRRTQAPISTRRTEIEQEPLRLDFDKASAYARAQAAVNKDLAQGAAALGSTRQRSKF